MTPDRIKHYKSQGWDFSVAEFTGGHNNDTDYTCEFISPRLKIHLGKDWVSIYTKGPYAPRANWNNIQEDDLLEAEMEAYAKAMMADWENEELLIEAIVGSLRCSEIQANKGKLSVSFDLKLR